ncbi:carboxypeptidase-like regulatory domain-containing protein [Ferruginibacter albus]|uniref:carboxypeptidase-like regulatory domain-containing protein n=1 Tax=Ferruginibacter albus TaxID=2875540 RepID=UPI001CC73CD2|nr:carboxypeptidase-like regulatory domain-containing protein [Ferruginibacter albus]UAY53025.1 carboxypeptidase-like regulatory domain-containing protein [Ferruginibacter albus]
MKKTIFSIPTPCHEDWNNMTSTEKGRFCLSCKKEVIDFTIMADSEVIRHFDKATNEVCGRFLPEQLERQMTAPKKPFFGLNYFFSVLIPAFLFVQKANAQKQPVAESISIVDNQKNSDQLFAKGEIAVAAKQTIKGKVTDNKGQPIPYATVTLRNKSRGVITDSAGNFVLDLPYKSKPIAIIVSSIGYESQTMIVNPDSFNTIRLVVLPVTTQGDVVVVIAGAVRRKKQIKTRTKAAAIFNKVIDSLNRKNLINVYPNPVSHNSVVTIDMKNVQKGEYALLVVNIDGSILQEATIQVPVSDYIFHLDLKAGITNGTYFIKIMAPDKKIVHTGKILVIN